MFFATSGLEVYEQFAEAVFPAKSIPCTVFLDGDGNDAELICPFDIAVALTWTWPEGRFPFSDGDAVRLYMEYGNYDPPTYAMAVFDVSDQLLALTSSHLHLLASEILDCSGVEAIVQSHYACEYDPSEAPLIGWPNSDEVGCCGWTRVFGYSGSGHYAEIGWSLQFPGDTSVSEDGIYSIALPVNYYGEIYDEDFPDFVGYNDNFVLQIVRDWAGS